MYHPNRSEIIMFVAPSLLVVFGTYCQRMTRDAFSQELRALVGEKAIHCSTRQCELNAFARRQPFWTRVEGHYEPVLSCNTEPATDYSKATVFTVTGQYYELIRYPPRGLFPPRVVKRRWVNPHLAPGAPGEFICGETIQLKCAANSS